MDDIKPIKIVAMGQSLASGLFSSYEDRSNVGMRALVQNFEGRAAVPAQFENAAIPNTPLLRRYRRRRSWWDEDMDIPGRLLINAVGNFPEADIVLWSQGENDASDANLDVEVYEKSLRNLFFFLRRTYGCFIICNFIGRRIGGNDASTRLIHQVQRSLTSSMDFVFEGAEQYQSKLFDNVHPNNVGFCQIGALTGQAIAAAYLQEVDVYPRVTHVVASLNIVVFHLYGPNHWAIDGIRVSNICEIPPHRGISQFVVVDSAGKILNPNFLYFDPNENEVFLVFEPEVIITPNAFTAYVVYGNSASLDVASVITEYSALSRPVRRGEFPISHLREAM